MRFFDKLDLCDTGFNVAIFCYIAQYAVPELARGLAHDQQKLAPAIVTGMSLTMVLLALVPLAVLSLTGPENVTQVATIAWGKALGEWAFFYGQSICSCCDDDFLLGSCRQFSYQHRG